MIRLWTDGCCLSNPGGPGGWAFIAEEGGRVLHTASGSESTTTNNRMELAAVIESLRWAIPREGRILVRPDSEYVAKGATEWMPKWKANGWAKRPNGCGKVKNLRLWKDLDALLTQHVALSRRHVDFKWVRGHAGAQFNEQADVLAGEAARREPD